MYSQIYISLLDSCIKSLVNPIQQTKLGIGGDDTTINFQFFTFEKIKNYHFKCSIPYAKETIKFEMYFNPLYPELGPDLVFDDEEFLQLDNIIYFENKLSSLCKWNTDNSNCLLNVLQEIFELYKQYQMHHLKIYKLPTNCIELIHNIQPNNLEIIIVQRCKQIEAKLFMKLDLMLSTKLFKKSTKVAILFLFSIMISSQNSITLKLYLPLYLKNLFNGSEALHVPLLDFPYFHNYELVLKRCITEKIDTISNNMQKRKNFIAVLLVLFSPFVIEYDIIGYREASLLFKYSDGTFILIFMLPDRFPLKQFSMNLHPVQYMPDKEIFNRNMIDFPYDSKWESENMIIEAVKYIFEKLIKND